MPITCVEKSGSGTLSQGEDTGSGELLYIVSGTSDEQQALDAVKAVAPATHKGLKRSEVSVEPTDKASRWEGTARYELEPADGETTFRFETGGGSQHITNSLSTISRTAPSGKVAPDFKGAIGVTADSVEGVDITVPVFNFEATYYKDSLTAPYLAALYNLTGKVNQATFTVTVDGVDLEFAAGECLFLGASGGKTVGKGQWEINCKFAASPNLTNIAVGDITVPAKKGWEYLWVRYEDVEDATAKAVVKRPLAAYVEKVYRDGDFSVL